MNTVDILKTRIEALADSNDLCVQFRQTNKLSNAAVSRVYLHPKGTDAPTYRNPNVVRVWGFNGRQDDGCTERCARYACYLEVFAYLEKLS